MPDPERDNFVGESNGGDPSAAHRKNGDIRAAEVVELPRMFSGILPDGYAVIRRAGRAKEFARGEVLYSEDEKVQQVFLLTSGSVKITKLGRGGEEVILRFAAPGDVQGAVGLFSRGTHCTTAEASRSSQALVWDAWVFKDLAERFPVLHRNMAAILGERLRELQDRFREVATDKVGPRVALQLLRLLRTIGRPVIAGVEIGLSRLDLAQMTGTTLFTVSRLLSAWEVRGAVRPRREAVAICDVQKLCEISLEE